MRSLIVLALLAPPAVYAQQLGVPLSSLPGVEAGIAAEAGAALQGGVQGITLPTGTLNQLMMAPASASSAGANIGAQIENSFYGAQASPAATTTTGYGMSGGAVRALG